MKSNRRVTASPSSRSINLRRSGLALALAAAISSTQASPPPHFLEATSPTIDALAAARRNASLILLRAGIFDPAAQQLDLTATGAAAAAASGLGIVQFEAGRLGESKALAALGVNIVGYVPNNAYLVRLGATSLDTLRAIPGVRWAGAYRAGFKVDPGLWTSRRSALKAGTDQRYALQVSGFAGQSLDAAAATLRAQLPDVRIADVTADRFLPTLRLSVAADDLARAVAAASALDAVGYIEPFVAPRLDNSGSIATIQGNMSGDVAGVGAVGAPTPLWDHQIFGSGQIVASMDSGVDHNEAWFTTLDKGSGPVTALTPAEDTTPPALGTLHPDNKIVGYFVQPGSTAYDSDGVECSPGAGGLSFHGTHTSGTIVGDAAGTFGSATYLAATPNAANHDLADGMAPNAQLLFQDIGNDSTGCLAIQDLGASIDQAHAAGAGLQNNSWGGPTQGAYSASDTIADAHSRDLDTMLLVVSAGNDGMAGGIVGACATGQTEPIPGNSKYLCLQTVGSPGNAKNVLTIGASTHGGLNEMTSFSSRGPTADGRQKPDIVAPGAGAESVDILGSGGISSAAGNSNDGDTIQAPVSKLLSGTSMAAPTITGNATLLRQFYQDGFYPRGERTPADTLNPSGALLKAVLVNATVTNLSNTKSTGTTLPWPNQHSGWGRPWLDASLWFRSTLAGGDDSRRTRLIDRPNSAGLTTGESDSFTIQNVEAGKELRVSLTWYDPQAALAAATTLVNNLDLEVTAPDGSVYKGNVFANDQSATGGDADAINTVEQVRLTTPVAGAYTIKVSGTAVPGNGQSDTDAQGYALAVTGGFGLPDTAALPAPSALAVASNDAGGVAIGFTGSSGAQGYQLYRAAGTCASAAPGDFRFVANGTAAPLTDTHTQGGFSYAYKVRGIQNDVEGDASACVDVVSAAPCTLQPLFGAGAVSAGAAHASCSVTLNWPTAAASCPAGGSITYAVERASDPYFTTPEPLASALATASYTDTTVANGTPYYYRVTASDSLGNPSAPTPAVGVTPSGAAGPDPSSYFDNVDDATYLTLDPAWQATDTFAADGTLSYHNGPDGGVYPSDTCSSATTPTLTLPAGATMSFQARYDMEYQWDGAVLEISTDDGATWADLPPDGGYPTTLAQTQNNNACGFPSTRGVFSGVSTAASNADPGNGTATPVFKPFAVDLASFAGQSVKIRWRFTSDGNTEFAGFFLDQIRIGDANAVVDRLFADGFDGAGSGGGDYVCH
ncbi:S8 family serine peptidase [Dokdonella sp.]|uniref:S8 family serine peptidase n=1 Tax=Dokdonella sp. TaxID=2291710 RepID=UPI001B27D36B|nr:S8 family serine peptidase [Dokdonella sp.]MBO9663079.1 S8 family serine peptidase [Dokdonella sp.]